MKHKTHAWYKIDKISKENNIIAKFLLKFMDFDNIIQT